MGIDARLLLRYKGDKPSDQQIAEWGDQLGRSIGANKFFISDGLPSPEYHQAYRAWHEAFNAHPRHDDWKAHYDNFELRKEIHEQIFADVGPPPQQLRRAIALTNYDYPLSRRRRTRKAMGVGVGVKRSRCLIVSLASVISKTVPRSTPSPVSGYWKSTSPRATTASTTNVATY